MDGHKEIPYVAFGHVILKNELQPGTLVNNSFMKDGVYVVTNSSPFFDGDFGDGFGYLWLYTKGTTEVKNVDTGNTSIRTAGYCNKEVLEEIGTNKKTYLDEVHLFCVGGVLSNRNKKFPKEVQVFKLLTGNSVVLEKDTKLFLAAGVLDIEGKIVNKTGQIKVASNSKTFTAVENCYGYIFP